MAPKVGAEPKRLAPGAELTVEDGTVLKENPPVVNKIVPVLLSTHLRLKKHLW